MVNKADLVSEEQRKEWAKYFNEKNIDFIFFSAVEEQERLEDEAEKEERLRRLYRPYHAAYADLAKKDARPGHLCCAQFHTTPERAAPAPLGSRRALRR